MKIYTKTGDGGTTSLIGGKRVPKNHPRVEVYGDTDELISYIGIIIATCKSIPLPSEYTKTITASLLRIQKALMVVSAHFATPEEGASKSFAPIDNSEIEYLESEIDRMTSEMPPQRAFILPGAPIQAAQCQYARTICRRVERRSLSITTGEESASNEIATCKRYLNRLSDYLFTLGRYFCTITKTEEEFWLP